MWGNAQLNFPNESPVLCPPTEFHILSTVTIILMNMYTRDEWQLYICNLFTYKSPKTEAKAMLSAAYLLHKCVIHCHHKCNCAKRLQGYILCWRNNMILTVINHIKWLVSLKQRKNNVSPVYFSFKIQCIPVALNMLLNLIFYWPSCLLNNQISFNFHLTDLLSEIDKS